VKKSFGLFAVLAVILLAVPEQSSALDEDSMKAFCTEKKDADQCFALGEKYRTVDMNNTAAMEFFTLGCKLEHMTSCVHAGILIQQKGTQNSPEWKEAGELYQKACDQHHDRGCFNLATLKYKEGRANKAKELYQLSCDYGNKVACDNMKKILK
jgi:TPR repeat protein